MEDIKQDDGITLGQLFKVIFGRWKLFLAVFIATALVVIMAITFAYNKNKKVYTASFDLTLTNVNEGKYIDGSTFDYRDLVTIDTLNDVKNSNESFSNISVESLVDKGGISISKEEILDTKDNTSVKNIKYSITAQQKYFKSSTQAREFINAIASVPVKRTIVMLDFMNYSSNIDAFNKAQLYDDQVKLLSAQYDLILENYETLTKTYGDVKLHGEEFKNRTISNELTSVTVAFNNQPISTLQIEIDNNGFVKNYESNSIILRNQLDDLYNTYSNNEKTIEKLQGIEEGLVSKGTNGQSYDFASFNETITELSVSNSKIIDDMRKILRKLAIQTEAATLEAEYTNLLGDDKLFKTEDIYKKLPTEEDKVKFEAKINTQYRDKLVEFTNNFKKVQKDVVSNYSKVNYDKSSVITYNGGLSTAKTVIAALALGFIVACLVNLIVDGKHLHDDNKKQIAE
jgi:hypothetical protein